LTEESKQLAAQRSISDGQQAQGASLNQTPMSDHENQHSDTEPADAVTPDVDVDVDGPLGTPVQIADLPAHRPELPKRATSGSTVSWLMAALVWVVICVVGAGIGAHALAKHDAGKAQESFQSSSAAVAATVAQSIQQQADLVSGAGTYFAGNSNTKPAEFETWARHVHALARFPQIERMSLAAIVRAPDLHAYETQIDRSSKQPLRINPSGSRSFYCFTLSEIARSPAQPLEAGRDYCGRTHALLIARDTGKTSYQATAAHGVPALRIQTPVYMGDAVPETQTDRIAAFAGWVRETVIPGVMLRQALQAHGGGNGSISFQNGATSARFSVGKIPKKNGQSRATDLPGGWTVTSYAPAASTSIFDDPGSLALVALGLVLSLLVGALIFVLGMPRLGRGEARSPRGGDRPKNQDGGGKAEELYDTLTGLPNRALAFDRAERVLARAGRESGLLAGALIVDVDWFKDFNDKLGQEAGDQLLRTVAERLQTVVRSHDTVGRLGGDRFLIIVEVAARGARLDSLARRITEALHKPVELDDFGPSFFMTASIGVAFGRYETPDELVRDTQLALQASKSAGKDRYTMFNANMRSLIEDRAVLEAELNAALAEHQFFLVYQPVLDLATQKVVGLEALLRWMHPKRGVLTPAEFLPVAEDTGLIVPIGRWALEEATQRGAAWDVAGSPLEIAVSVSPNQFNREGFATDVLRALQQSGIRPELLTLEIAEPTIMADLSDATRRLDEMKRLGVKLAIDEFGNGYAYRSDLQRMPLDYLKVDRSSLAASDDEDYRSWLLEAILVFGRDLSLTVVAKGVETYEQMIALRDGGCPLAQGFFLGKPMPAEAVEGLLRVVPQNASATPGALASTAAATIAPPVPVPVPVSVPVPPESAGFPAVDAPPAPAPATEQSPSATDGPDGLGGSDPLI
jgi:diguanylate cyclase (GGDEF)-like protein